MKKLYIVSGLVFLSSKINNKTLHTSMDLYLGEDTY